MSWPVNKADFFCTLRNAPSRRSRIRCTVCLNARERRGWSRAQGSRRMTRFRAAAAFALVLVAFSARAADYPAPKEGQWIARDFKFHTGDVLPELRPALTTVGQAGGPPVALLP